MKEVRAVFVSTLKRFASVWLIATLVLSLLMCFSVYDINSNSMVGYRLQPFIWGSEKLDLFFALFTSAVFAWNLYFLRKNNFLKYAAIRISQKKFIAIQVITALLLCFLMVFVTYMIGVIFSVSISAGSTNALVHGMEGYIFGSMHMSDPLLFGVLWSAYKGVIGALICLFGQILSIYLRNLFVILLFPFVYVLLENFTASVLSLPEYGFSTSFILNRLSPEAMKIENIALAILIFSIVLVVCNFVLRGKYGKYNKA